MSVDQLKEWHPIISIAISTIIAVIGVAISLASVNESKRQFKTSLEPRVVITYHPYVSPASYMGDMKLMNLDSAAVGWTIENKGLGPAVVHWTWIDSHLGEIHDVESFIINTGLHDFLKSTNPDSGIKLEVFSNHPQKNDYLTQGEKRAIFLAQDNDVRRFYDLNYKSVLIQTCYCSTYEECWIADNTGSVETMNKCPERTPAIVYDSRY